MSEKKIDTLADLRCDVFECGCEDDGLGREAGYTEELLKETAVEWIKYYENIKLPKSIPENVREYGTGMTIDFIKHFFNITKEDLERETP